MPNSTFTSTEAAFVIAKRVYAGEVTQADAARELNVNSSVNINSAKIMITVYSQLVKGNEFKRALSAPDMNYFMARIYSEGNLDSLKKPTSAFWKHIVYYEEKNKVTLNALRDIASQYSILCDSVSDTDKITNDFHLLVTKSIEGDANNRKKRLATSQSKPKTRIIAVKVFDRNPDVVAEVLLRANGVCELCEKTAPFNRKKDNSPYLEVHHKKRLADGGDDNLNNAIGLCPNCHRKLHYGCNSN